VFDAFRGRAKKHPQEPSFAHPPVWIHASLAAKCFSGKESPLLISRRREAKRRALLQMLDRLPIRSESLRTSRQKPLESSTPAPDLPLPRPVADAGTRVQK
jgi:hypothetical protein